MSAGQGPKNWVKLDTDPAVLRLLEQYTAILAKKMGRTNDKALHPGRVVGAIVSRFLLEQKDRIQDEYEQVLLWAARDIVRNSLDRFELEATGLSEVPYVPRTSSGRERIPGTKRPKAKGFIRGVIGS